MNEPRKAMTGRPRSQESHDAILEATLDLLRQRPYTEVSIEAIAAQAGVSKATIYRWWPNRVSLEIEVLVKSAHLPEFSYDGSNLYKYLYTSLKGCAQNLLQGELAPAIAGVIADTRHDPALRALFHDEFFARLQAIGLRDLQKAIELGQLPADTNREILLDQLFGPLYYRLLIAGKPVDDGYIRQLLQNLNLSQ